MHKRKIMPESVEIIEDRCVIKNRDGNPTCYLKQEDAQRMGLVEKAIRQKNRNE